MAIKDVKVPDLGGADAVDVIEILVKSGDKVALEDALITLESDKASMDVPSPLAGIVKDIKVKVGDKVSENSLILTLEQESDEGEQSQEKEKQPVTETTAMSSESQTMDADKTEEKTDKSLREIFIPDLSGITDVDVIELLVNPGDKVEKEDSLITLESEKASMDVPSPYAGIFKEFKLKVGDKINQGDILGLIETEEKSEQVASDKSEGTSVQSKAQPKSSDESTESTKTGQTSSISGQTQGNDIIHAGPAVRRLARELGVNLSQVTGSGAKGRVLKEDVQKFVKTTLANTSSSGASTFNLPPAPKIDFSRFGDTETQPLSKIKRLTGINTHRSWVNVPHVTQFDEADITEMEAFRKAKNLQAQKSGEYKLTPLVFLMKAVVKGLQLYPTFNASLDASGENLILKKYFHIGVAVDTPNGLVVPVIRNVDQKSLIELSQELRQISTKAREKGLMPAEMMGSCFTISSLGGIGGTAFTPIVNTPDVAILGVSKSKMAPVWDGKAFIPRLILPLSLSYDHRVIDGAQAARFTNLLSCLLADIRELLL